MKLEKCFFDFAKFHKWEIYHKIEETIRIPVVCLFYYQKNYYRQRTSFATVNSFKEFVLSDLPSSRFVFTGL